MVKILKMNNTKKLLIGLVIIGVLFQACTRGSLVDDSLRVSKPFVLEEIKSHSVYSEYYFYTEDKLPQRIIIEDITGKFAIGDTLIFTSKTDTIGNKK